MHNFPRTLLRRARRVLHRVLRGKRTARALVPESLLHADERAPILLSASPVLAPLGNDGDAIFPVELEQAVFKITAMMHPTTSLPLCESLVGVLPASPVLAPLADIGDPIFPVELEQAIFKITAMMHPTTIPALLRVARRVGIWVEPLLYRVVRVSRRVNFNGMVRALIDGTKSRPAELLCTYVRHLTLESLHHCSFYEGRSLLQRCRKVNDFSSNLWFTNPSLLPILAEMHLERLFVIGLYGDYWADWEAGARGGADAWCRGDDFVARKRGGLIEETCYWLT
ncbi:hypothetical protein DFH08DRAFT_975314 [Mycena albidolilacea]|uniref:Uncharacterized protein n=1 Tax=Mycena albidolilacea TaxID=1033008 RepID=A0AAD6Z5K8_9AGAR|nr:hypothetical protein DFH08DRAFT_975314 [Mycena albidolilacea]